MKKIEIYTKDYCSFCHRAKKLLQSKGAEFAEYDITTDALKGKEMRERSDHITVPAIFVDNQLLGGCDDLFDLEASGELETRLGL